MKTLSVVTAAFMITILGLGIFLRAVNLTNVARRSPDEGIYTYQAKVISIEGPVKGTRFLIREFNSNSQLWIYPPPTRIGYDWLLACVIKILGRADTDVGAYISFIASVFSLILIAVIGSRFFNPWIALFAMLLMAVSPMELAIARRTWPDALVGAIGLSMAYFCLEITRDTKKLFWYALLVTFGSYIMLIKEAGIAVYGLCALWISWVLIVRERSFLKGLAFLAAAAAGAFLSATFLAGAAGGTETVLELFRHFKDAGPINPYAIEYQSGPWYNFVVGLWIISPISFLLFIIGSAGTLLPVGLSDLNKNRIRTAATWLILFGVAFFSSIIITPYCQNYRYLSVLYAPFYLVAGIGLWYLISLVKPFIKDISTIAAIVLAAALMIVAINDYQIFKKTFIRTGIMDVSVKMIMDLSR